MSSEDPVGRGCFKLFVETGEFTEKVPGKRYSSSLFELLLVNKSLLSLEAQDLLEVETAQELVFISKHASTSGKSCFTVHSPGNWGLNSEFGGNPEELGISSPQTIRKLFLGLLNAVELKEELVSLEVTHHGPTALSLPVTFLELGSSETAWNDLEKQKILLKSVKALESDEVVPAGVGFGGGHYAPQFSKLLVEELVSFGHVCPKYAPLTEKTLKQAIGKTLGCKFAFIDKKGTTRERRALLRDFCKQINLEVLER